MQPWDLSVIVHNSQHHRLRQNQQFPGSLGYITRLCLKAKIQKKVHCFWKGPNTSNPPHTHQVDQDWGLGHEAMGLE